MGLNIENLTKELIAVCKKHGVDFLHWKCLVNEQSSGNIHYEEQIKNAAAKYLIVSPGGFTVYEEGKERRIFFSVVPKGAGE